MLLSLILIHPCSAGDGTKALHPVGSRKQRYGYSLYLYSCTQWLFIVEGIPSVLLGMATYWLLPSHPLWDAWMLTPAEREALHLRVGGIGKRWSQRDTSWLQASLVFAVRAVAKNVPCSNSICG